MKNSKFRSWKSALFPVFVLFSIVPFATVHSQDGDELPLVLDSDSSDSSNVIENATTTYADEAPTESAVVTEAPVNANVTPDEAYRQLVAGNARYLKEDSNAARALPRHVVNGTSYPIATVLYSLDMPILPTILTQTTDHDVYLSGVTAGAVSSDDLASVEYGILNLQTPLLVVMGHYPSRDVSELIRKYDLLEQKAQTESAKIAASGAKTLPSGTTSAEMKLYNLVGPAIARSKQAYPDLQGYDLANIVSEALVWQSIETILMKSTAAQDLVRAGRLNVIAAISDDSTGKIYWLGEHPLQEEFLRQPPENLRNTEAQNEIVTEAELPQAIDNATVQSYVDQYEANGYYNAVVSDYYVQPVYYAPSWELFSSNAWTYRPWYGVWVDSFVPWPYWRPWGYPPGIGGIDVSIWGGRLNFFIGYNRYWGPHQPWDPNFRPHSPWWSIDIFLNPPHHGGPDIFDLIWEGRRGEIHFEPFDHRPWHTPTPFRPNDAGPHDVPGPHGGHDAPVGGRPSDAPRPGGYHPGDARPGIGSRFGSAIGFGGGRPGILPGIIGGRADSNPSRTNPGAGGAERSQGGKSESGAANPGSNRVNRGSQPADGNPGRTPAGPSTNRTGRGFGIGGGRSGGPVRGAAPSHGASNSLGNPSGSAIASTSTQGETNPGERMAARENLKGIRPVSLNGDDSLHLARPSALKKAGDAKASPLPTAAESKTTGSNATRGSLAQVRPAGLASAKSSNSALGRSNVGALGGRAQDSAKSFGAASRGSLAEIGALRAGAANTTSVFSASRPTATSALPHAQPAGPSPAGLSSLHK